MVLNFDTFADWTIKSKQKPEKKRKKGKDKEKCTQNKRDRQAGSKNNKNIFSEDELTHLPIS